MKPCNENMKIYYRPRTWIMAGLVLVATICFAFLLKSFGTDGFINTLAFASNAASLTFLVFIFSVVIAADIVAGEFTWGTIKLLLIRPASRSKILASKYIAVLLFVLTLLVVHFISAYFTGLLLFGVGGQVGEGVTMGNIVRTYLLHAVNIVMAVTLAFMISAVFRSSSLAIGLSIFLLWTKDGIVAALVSLKYEWVKYFVFANTDLTPYIVGGKPLLPGMTLGFSVTVLVLYWLLFYGISWLLFTKRDVAGS